MPGKRARQDRAASNTRSRVSGVGKYKGSKSSARYHYKHAAAAARKPNPGWKRYATSYGVYKVKKQGGAWIVQSPDGSKFPYSSREAAMKHFVGYTKPARKNPTKKQKREKAKKASASRRVALALANFLKQANPAMKTAGATVTKLKGGGFTIRPIKAVKRGRK